MPLTRLLLPLALCLALASCGERSAGLFIEQPHVDYGVHNVDEQLTLEIPVRNRGRAAISVLDSKVDCSCIRVTAPAEQLSPGGEGKVKVAIDCRAAGLGKHEKTIDLFYGEQDDPQTARVHLYFEVRKGLMVEPASVHEMNFSGGELTQSVEISCDMAEGYEILDLSTDSQSIQLTNAEGVAGNIVVIGSPISFQITVPRGHHNYTPLRSRVRLRYLDGHTGETGTKEIPIFIRFTRSDQQDEASLTETAG